MFCDKKKCKKCGLWWTITAKDFITEKKETYGICGMLAIHSELVKQNVNLLGVRQDTQSRGNVVTEGLSHLINTKRLMGG